MTRSYFALALLVVMAVSGVAAALPPKASVLGDGMKAIRYWKELVNSTHTSCGWETGTFMTGVMAMQQV